MKLIKKKMKVWRTRFDRLENKEPVGSRLAASFLPFCAVSRSLSNGKSWEKMRAVVQRQAGCWALLGLLQCAHF